MQSGVCMYIYKVIHVLALVVEVVSVTAKIV